MNVFGFDYLLAIQGLFYAFFMGMFFGFFIGLLRYVIFGTLEGTSPSRGG